jgi:hypothetical protein
MYPGFKELLSTFNAHGVRYPIVGGYAVTFHAQPCATKDLDPFIRPEAGNAQAVYAALAASPTIFSTVTDSSAWAG